MNRIRAFLAAFFVALAGFAAAQVIPSLPYNLTNGTIADANQVMANFNQIVSSTNSNAANAGANTNITALLGLTTPLAPSVGGSSVYTGGTSGGSANAQTVLSPSPSGYTVAAGRTVIFVAGFTNNAATTLNVNSTGAINVYKKTVSGISALVGGEIVVGQVTVVNYDGTQYQLIDASAQSLVPACTTIDYSGHTVPSGYLSADGSAVSRTTYSNLFACLSRTGVAATTTSGSGSVAVANSALYQVGWFVGGTNVTCDSTITSIPDGTHVVISNNAGASGATTLTIGPNSQGDCSTTFGLPNYKGRVTAMADASGGTVLTSTTCTNPNSIGTACGTQTVTLVSGNLPAYTPAGTITTTITQTALGNNGTAANTMRAITNTTTGPLQYGGGGSGADFGNAYILATSSFTGTAQGGTSTPVNKVQPTALVTKAIKF